MTSNANAAQRFIDAPLTPREQLSKDFPDGDAKPNGAHAEKKSLRIKAITSVPRLGWLDHFQCISLVLQARGIPLSFFKGAYWEMGMQRALAACIGNGCEAILTMDYDTLFTTDDINTLFKWFLQHPECDAICGIQPRRGSGTPLMTVRNDEGAFIHKIEWDGPAKAYTAHFGLTLFRASAFEGLPLPWLWSLPSGCKEITLPNGNRAIELSPDGGSWDDKGCLHADMYFWTQWAKHGRSLYVHPDVRIGHLEVRCSKFDDDMELKHMSIEDWRNRYGELAAQVDSDMKGSRQ